jgi:methionine aminopeptidase
VVELKTSAEIDAMAAAGAVVAEALTAVVEHARPGRSTTELDRVAADVLARHGATSPFLNYHPRWAASPFPAVLCVSVNDAVVHGIPNGHALADGGRESRRWVYFFPKSPAAVILSPSLTAENPASVNSQSVMIAR